MKITLTAGEFQYVEYGEASAPPMVLVHGSHTDGSTWAAVAPELARSRRVIALDQRGHGGSVRTSSYSFELMRADLLEFVDGLGLEKFLLCGHSMGGTVAALFAERYAERLSGLILIDSPPPDGHGDWTVPSKPEEQLGFDWEVVVAIFAQLADPDPAWWADLPAITVPTLVVGGGSTSPVPQELLAKVVELVPDAKLITIEGAGHAVQRTRPAELLHAIHARFGT
ncbi:alpha/beta fold hydrolase [Kribbella monticola]|uniref:alpha/beta fold hydrolase n=1 Tax=Kribbella monticola TaxID=2185285 RepID=UPI0018E505E3|nr:alpha/beta hydrolase [Kribbella monticola]